MSIEKKKEWQVELFMEKLRTKANHLKSLTLNESAKVLKMTLMERRFGSDTAEKAQFQKCLDVLQTSIKITSLQAMVERLESVSRQLGLKFTAGPSGVDWFISSDMFYLEVVLETTGQVKDVKIQHEGKAEQQSCPDIVECLAEGDFSAFSGHLEGLASIYQINADKKMKAKSFMALGALEADLVMLSQLQSNVINETTNLVHKSPVGILQKRKGGYSVKLTYFVSPYDLLDLESSSSLPLTVEAITQRNLGYHVTVGIECASSHKLQVTTLVSAQRGPDGKAFPSVSPLTASNSTTLPAWFVLRLEQPMPVCLSLVRKLQEFTGLEFGDLSQAQPLFSLLTTHVSNGSLDCANNRGLFVTLPDQQHCYFLTEIPELQGLLLSSIPFTHPTHVAHILNVLRQQALFNTLISSCVRPLSKPDLENAITFEVSALSVSSISICFEHPNDEGMCTVDMDLTDIASIKARLYSAYATEDNAICSEEYISKVVQHCQSIPVTMRALLRKAQAQAQWRKEDPVCELGLDGYSASGHDDGSNLFPNDFARLGDQNSLSLRDQLPSLQYDQHNHKSPYDELQSDLFPITPSLNDLLDRKAQDDSRAGTQAKKPTLARFKSEPGRSQRADPDFLLHSPVSSDIGSYSLPPNVNAPYEVNRSGIGSTGNNLVPTHSRRHSVDNAYMKPETDLEDMELDPEAKDGGATAGTDSTDTPTVYNVSSVSVSKDRNTAGTGGSNSSSKKDNNANKGDKALFPSVSITPVSPSFNPSLSSNYPSLNLERRPGIEIIPLSANPASNTLPSSLTITPVTLKSGEKKEKDKFKEFKVKESKIYDLEDSRKEEKKERKRKREEMLTGGKPAKMLNTMAAMMGPPPQMLVKTTAGGGASGSADKKTDASRLPNLSIKPSVPSPLASPTSSSAPGGGASGPGGGALFINSNLALNSPTSKKATSPSLSFPPLKPAKPFTAISPKHSTTPPSSSPKHSISSSPKHHPSSGKPSMSALKSAASPSLPKASPVASGALSPTKSKHKRDKDKKSSTPTPEGKPKPVLTKTKSFELPSDLEDDDDDSEVSAIIGQGGASTENLFALLDNNPEGASPTDPMRHSSNELSKSPVRAASGKKISLSAVVDKLRSQQSDGPGPPGVPGNPVPGDEMKEEKKETKEGEKKKEGGAKGSGEFVVKQSSQGIKLTINKTKKEEGKSSKHSSSEGGVAKSSSLTALKSSTGSSSSSKKTSSSPSRPESASKSRPPSSSPKTVLSGEKRDKDKLKEKMRDKYGNSLARSSSSSALDAKKAENKVKQDLENEKVFKMLLAQSKLDKKFQIPKLPKPGDKDREREKEKMKEKEKEERKNEEAREDKLELEREDREDEGKHDSSKDRPKSLPILSSSAASTDKSGNNEEETFKLLEEINKAKTKMEAPPSRPSPATTPRPPSTLSGGGGAPMPPLSFPASPAVSVHILKSPAPMNSPLAVISPHSLISQASPCVIDDDLMDEALVGLGK